MTAGTASRIARLLSFAAVLLFIAAVVANRFGANLQLMTMSPEWRERADLVALRAQWVGRSIPLFILSMITGAAGVACSIKAADREQ